MRSAAGRLHSVGRNLLIDDRRTLFNGWIRSIPMCNGLAFLPHLCESQLQQLTSAYNSGIRAIHGLPKKGYAPISDLCKRLKLPNLHQIKESILLLEAWKSCTAFSIKMEGPVTRGRANLNVPLPDKKGICGKMLSTILHDFWNKLPLDVKLEECPKKAKNDIKKLAFNF